MSLINIVAKQYSDIRQGGHAVFYGKLKILFKTLLSLPLYLIAFPIAIIVRLVSRWYLIRFGALMNSRIGHLAANVELYFCEKKEGINVPNRPYLDIFFLKDKVTCNKELIKIWKRYLLILPAYILYPIYRSIGILPGGKKHLVGQNTQNDRDVHNLLDKYPAHLRFTLDEENRGKTNLKAMGIPLGAPFVCFIIRDKEYLDKQIPGNNWSYHNYRDCSIENYVLAAEALVDKGYYVIRMGAFVGKAFPSDNPKIIDYAFNGMRTEFMDIYLGAKCTFCVSTGTGWEYVPTYLFRKPGVFTNIAPIGYLPSFSKNFIVTVKKYFDNNKNLELSLSQIFSRGVGFTLFSSEYEVQHITLVENTPKEIYDVVLEMEDRISGNITKNEKDIHLQNRFWKLFTTNLTDEKREQFHGRILASFGAKYLENNQDWLK